MKEIKLKRVRIVNFKGHKELDLTFGDGVTNIHANNHRGKTSMVDGIIWCLYGVNSLGETKFDAMPVENGEPIFGLEKYVETYWDIGGYCKIMKRELKDEFTRKDDAGIKHFKGNKTVYSIDDFEASAKEYTEVVNELFGGELFYMLFSPSHFFNKTKGASIDWEWQRSKLVEISDETSDDDIAKSTKKDCDFILKYISEGKTLGDVKKMLKNKIAALEKERDAKDAVMEDKIKNLPPDVDTSKIEAELNALKKELETIEASETDIKSKIDSIIEKNKAVLADIQKKNELIGKITKEGEELLNKPVKEAEKLKLETENKIKEINRSIGESTDEINKIKMNLSELLDKQNKLREEFYTVRDQQIKELEQGVCPLKFTPCKSLLESHEENVKAHELKFEEDKKKRITIINEQGKDVAKLIDANTTALKSKEEFHEQLKAQHLGLVNKLNDIIIPKPVAFNPDNSEEIQSIRREIVELKLSINSVENNNEDQAVKKTDLKSRIASKEEEIRSSSKRKEVLFEIEGLKKEKVQKADEIGTYRKKLDTLESFISAKMKLIEESVNTKFEKIQFKLFERQKNGVIKNSCIALLNGVPYQACSTSEKVFIGLDLIKTFSQENDVCFPILIDNRESVVKIDDMDNQIINMFVDERFDELTVV